MRRVLAESDTSAKTMRLQLLIALAALAPATRGGAEPPPAVTDAGYNMGKIPNMIQYGPRDT